MKNIFIELLMVFLENTMDIFAIYIKYRVLKKKEKVMI
jgi:hypothetical protein